MFDALADDFVDSMKDFTMRVGFLCVGEDELKALPKGRSNVRRRSDRLARIMSSSSSMSYSTTDSNDALSSNPSRPPSRSGHRVKETFAC